MILVSSKSLFLFLFLFLSPVVIATLSLLTISGSRNNISFLRLDGTLNLQQREKVIKEFTEESEIAVSQTIN